MKLIRRNIVVSANIIQMSYLNTKIHNYAMKHRRNSEVTCFAMVIFYDFKLTLSRTMTNCNIIFDNTSSDIYAIYLTSYHTTVVFHFTNYSH